MILDSSVIAVRKITGAFVARFTAVQIEYPFPSGKVISRSTRNYLLDAQIMILQKMIQYKTKYNEQLEREVKKKTRSLISYDYNYYL